MRFSAGEVRQLSGGIGRPALVIRGDGITVDFGGLTLRGTDPAVDPDRRTGLGVRIEGRNITLRNLSVHGYRVGILARNAPNLTLENLDASYNYRARLRSTTTKEDLADWMSYHQNERDEWLRYAAAVYLRNCDHARIKGLKVTGGQNGLMLTECDYGQVWNADIRYNSAIGLGLYRSSDNRVVHNRLDYNVRGHSNGVYNRGQDSAAILIYEQSHRNVFAYNRATHSGDGFFLWAGQSTMETAEGGCNDNLLYGNDFSHAPTNGIEATFSRNRFLNNLLLECWHGVWGGYSYDTRIEGNVFGYNTEGIAIEHGQTNRIAGNLFYRDGTNIKLWANASQDPNWGYPKHRDTRSRGYVISGNLFSQTTMGQTGVGEVKNAGRVLNVRGTENVTFGPNRYGPVDGLLELRGPLKDFTMSPVTIEHRRSTRDDATGDKETEESRITFGANQYTLSDGGYVALGGMQDGLLPPAHALTARLGDAVDAEYRARFRTNWNPLRMPLGTVVRLAGRDLGAVPAGVLAQAPAPLPNGMDPFAEPLPERGWRTIRMTEWGPYDGRSPWLWPESTRDGQTRFTVLGPQGRYRVEGVRGGVIRGDGRVPGTLTFIPDPSVANPRIALVYTGAATTDLKGQVTPADRPVRFGWSDIRIPQAWVVRVWPWTVASDAKAPHSVPEPTRLRAIWDTLAERQWRTDTLDFASSEGWQPGLPANRFTTVAEGSIRTERGRYALEVTADDGVRVWVDGRQVINAWKYQGPTTYSATLNLRAGAHKVRVEHFEIDGYAALQLRIRPAP